MVGNALEQEIISLYSDDVSSIYSINQIATRLGKKYPYINKKVTILIKNKIFKKTIAGRSYLCSLNLENEETVYLLILNEIKRKREAIQANKDLQACANYLEKLTKAVNIQLVLKKEDALFFILDNDEDKQRFEKAIIRQALPGHSIETHTKESFLKALIEDSSIKESHIILHGYEKYYEYVREVEDELKLRYSKITP